MGTEPRRRLLTRRDWGWLLGMATAGLMLRLAYWSGIGLLDDPHFHLFISTVSRGQVPPAEASNFTYRFTWWIPTVISARWFGVSELTLILPITAAATVGIGVVYALGVQLWGTTGGIIAAALLAVQPLDVAWSTMLANDIYLSLFSALCVLCVLRALEHPEPVWRKRLWSAAGAALFLAYHAKASGLLLLPVVGSLIWVGRARVDGTVGSFVGTTALLLGGSVVAAYAMNGYPLMPIHSELVAQGLTESSTARDHLLTREVFWTYPRLLFLRDSLGDFVFSLHPHALLVAALLAPLLGLRTSIAVALWLGWVFLGMQFNLQRLDGIWVAGFRNIRHAHAFVYPLVLLLAGYVVSLRARAPRLAYGLFALLLALGLHDSIAVASKTHLAFGEQHQALELLSSLPPKTVYADAQLKSTARVIMQSPGLSFYDIGRDAPTRRKRFATVAPGYAVTGGAGEPYYGCGECIPRAEELDPARWRLVKEFPMQIEPTPWRPEPLRIWETTSN